MMNYYERVQKAIDYIESNLETELDLQEISKEAYMSLASLYRLFFSLTGFTMKDYIRRRRINQASVRLLDTNTGILDISFHFGFESQEAFTRSFKQLTGLTPGAFRKTKAEYHFERVNVVEQYFEDLDPKLAEKYPDIKVIKELKPVRVVYYRHISITPEHDAWSVLQAWIRNHDLDGEESKLRIFGFNNPNPPRDYISGQTEYGYEFMATIPEDLVVEDDRIKSKIFPGGRYVVMSISNVDGDGIAKAWKRFNQWIRAGKYLPGNHQWLEEHLSFCGDDSENKKMDLYMPLSGVDKVDFEKKLSFETVNPFTVAVYRATGERPWDEAWRVILDWAQQNGYLAENVNRRFISYSSIPAAYPGSPGFWFEVGLEVAEGARTQDQLVKMKKFKGGLYATIETDRKIADSQWGLLEKWMFNSERYTYEPKNQWFQEQWIDGSVYPSSLPENYPVKCLTPVKELKEKSKK